MWGLICPHRQRHWWIDNRAHWIRDKVFGEDASTTDIGTAPQVFAAFRNFAAARDYYASHPAALFRRLQLSSAGL